MRLTSAVSLGLDDASLLPTKIAPSMTRTMIWVLALGMKKPVRPKFAIQSQKHHQKTTIETGLKILRNLKVLEKTIRVPKRGMRITNSVNSSALMPSAHLILFNICPAQMILFRALL
jgi:hypothetical protein